MTIFVAKIPSTGQRYLIENCVKDVVSKLFRVSTQNNTWSPEHALVKYKSIILWWIKFACQRAIVVDFCAFVLILYATPAPPTSITRLSAYLSA
jgi:hypothetical protein